MVKRPCPTPPPALVAISRQMLDMYKDAGPPVASVAGGVPAGGPQVSAALEGSGGGGPGSAVLDSSHALRPPLKRRAEDGGAEAELGNEAKAAKLGTPQPETPR